MNKTPIETLAKLLKKADNLATLVNAEHKDDVIRFLRKIDINENGCWEWNGSYTGAYGSFKIKQQTSPFLSHRWSAKYLGNMDIDNLFVCHKCDNTKCVNPEHLFVGTHNDNVLDMISKGRAWGRYKK